MTPMRDLVTAPSRREDFLGRGSWDGATLAGRVAELAERRGDVVAVVDETGQRHSYSELAGGAGRLAAQLRERGVDAGDVVSVQLPNWYEAAVVAVAGLELAALTAFPSKGVYPFYTLDFLAVEAVCICGALLARRGRAGAPLVAFFALWGLASLVAYVVPTPFGGNLTRLNAFIFPIMLLTASLAGFRPRGLTAFALAGAIAYNLTPYLLLVPYRLDNRPASSSFWRSPIDFLHLHSGPGFRVEVVPTAAHWESYWLPRAGLPLARGWYRQLDMVDNPILYAKHLQPAAYRRWLRSVAVKYVVVPRTVLDPDGAAREARLVDSRSSGLVLAYRGKNWVIYRLPRATPLLTGPGAAVITSFGHEVIAGRVSTPGTYFLRAHYSRYFKLHGRGCLKPGPGSMTNLVLRQPGFFRVAIVASPDAVLDASLSSHSASC